MSVEIERVVSVRVKALREEHDISQAELARRTGVSPAAISLMEKGERGITLDTAKKLAEALGVGIDYLAGTVIYPNTEMTLRIELTKLRQRMYEISDDADVIRELETSPPHETGMWQFRCMESGYEIEQIQVYRTLDEVMMVNCPRLGCMRLEDYHNGLTSPQWFR